MSQEQQTDAKGQGGASSTPATSADGDLVHTVDMGIPTIPEGGGDADPEGANNTGGDKAEPDAKAKGDDKGDADDKGDGSDDRFDKHPRFQQLNDRVKKAEADNYALRQELEEFKAAKPSGDVSARDQEPTFKNVQEMSDEELLEWQQSDPKGYHANLLAQAKHEMGQDVSQSLDKQTYEAAIERTFDGFAEKNPEFDAMWDRGELQAYMNKHPGHNAISAYHELTQEKRIADAVEKAKDEAKKEAEKEFQENLKTRREAQVLSSGPSPASGTVDTIPPELQDTKKFGGRTSVLAKRSEARRLARQQGS